MKELNKKEIICLELGILLQGSFLYNRDLRLLEQIRSSGLIQTNRQWFTKRPRSCWIYRVEARALLRLVGRTDTRVGNHDKWTHGTHADFSFYTSNRWFMLLSSIQRVGWTIRLSLPGTHNETVYSVMSSIYTRTHTGR